MSDNTYWDGATWTTDKNTWIPTTGTTTWSIDVPLTPGDYRINTYAVDNAGNIEDWADDRPTVNFSVDPATPADTVVPESFIDPIGSPAAGLVTFTGTATDDDSGVATVFVRIRDLATNTYWDGATWTTDKVWIPATGTTTWSIDAPLSAGDHRINVYAVDNAGNIEDWGDGRPTVTFTVN